MGIPSISIAAPRRAASASVYEPTSGFKSCARKPQVGRGSSARPPRTRWSSAGQAPNLWIGQTRVTVTYDEPYLGGLRPWFLCSRDRGRCCRSCRFVYFPELLSSRCCHLDWSSRHLHRSVARGALHRVIRLRLIAGIDPRPFSAIPKRQRRHKRYARLAAKIIAEERQLRAHLRSVIGRLGACKGFTIPATRICNPRLFIDIAVGIRRAGHSVYPTAAATPGLQILGLIVSAKSAGRPDRNTRDQLFR